MLIYLFARDDVELGGESWELRIEQPQFFQQLQTQSDARVVLGGDGRLVFPVELLHCRAAA